MPTRTTEVRSRGPAERDGTDVRAGRPIPVHHVVARHGDEGLGVLRVPVGGGRDVVGVLRRVGRPWVPLRRGAGRGVARETVRPRRADLPAHWTLRPRRVGGARPQARPQRSRGGKRHATGELRGLSVVLACPLVAPRERARGYRRRSAWARERSLAEGRKPWGRQRCCRIRRSHAPALVSSWVAKPRS
jgi:hypothetical protein